MAPEDGRHIFSERRVSRIEEDRMTRRLAGRFLGALLSATCLATAGTPVYGQTPRMPWAEAKSPEAKPAEDEPQEKPKTPWEENTLFASLDE
jgi:hypothetical protein